ncbi:Acg family FMN-binding oxidoreductase [Myceligenerans salitolerans]|uniref:Nitroreductase family protein n=1 Tax=Myceligenerans salitolerans TaxID=1230528 RepID=A0ABS3IE73_9MICO|nr:nitroreductase family protein [Myceligenerans salitolerans]MBO0610723.1 nitroreductase family protein [Myceligenerans salitolerans]
MDVIDSRVERILEAAARAPSVDNTQPWHVDVTGSTVTLRADAARQLRHYDPHGREMLISCGAFLFTVRTAARRDALSAVVTVLPDPDDQLLVAEIQLEPGPVPDTDELELSVAIARRATSRVPFDDQPLSTDLLEAIRQAARDEGAQLRLIQPSEPVRQDVIGLMRRAEAIAGEDPAARAEEAAWTATDPGREDGIPRELLGPGADDEAPVRRFHAGTGHARFERHTTLAVLSTPGDSPRDWVAAGEALQHSLLVATTYFVHASFATTVLENPTTRHDLRRVLSLDGVPQMLMRLGYSPAPRHTPRRPVGRTSERSAP